MAKRFSRLKYALDTLRTPTGTGTTPNPPAGSVLEKFQEVYSKKRKLTYTRDSGSNAQEILKVTILPFFFGAAPDSQTIVAQSKRANDNSDFNAVQEACNQIPANIETDSVLKGFSPAKVTLFKPTGATKSEPSQITGVKYTKKLGASYTFPYGASATEKAEGNVRKDILSKVPETSKATLSFTSEKY